ncbi:DUF1018 domain-containing protein [bacterium]|nr:MAG: DUF1018 domain-containing protein [bacterium]
MDKKKLALIHIVKKELGLSDSEYRGLLQKAAGVRSAKELDNEKFKVLMNYFVRSPHYRLNAQGLTIRQKLFIKYLAQQLHWDQLHLDNFVHKYYGKTDIDTLTRKEAVKVIESLKHIRQHAAGAVKPAEAN